MLSREIAQSAADYALLDQNEAAVLELLMARPISFFPPLVLAYAHGLAARGFAVQHDGAWHITKAGLGAMGRTLH
ncbi:MAG: hypothetical protein AB7E80_15135 [Hyphomicrobiaceae bacterium]